MWQKQHIYLYMCLIHIASIYICNIYRCMKALFFSNQLKLRYSLILVSIYKEHLEQYKNLFIQPHSYEINMYTIFRFEESICHCGIVEFIGATA